MSQFGLEALQSYTDDMRKGNAIVHTLTIHGKPRVLESLVHEYGFDVNVQRASDQCTPLHCANFYGAQALADKLIALGADTAIENQWQEPAGQTKVGADCITARLQGTQTPEQVLQIVQADMPRFSDIDLVQAYDLLGKKTADYDSTYRTFHAGADGQLFQDPRFLLLVDASEAMVLQTASPERLQLWPALAWALVKLPNDRLKHAFQKTSQRWAQTGQHRRLFQRCDAQGLVKLAWSFAKLVGSDSAYDPLFGLLADSLAARVGDLDADSIATLAWAYAKQGGAGLQQDLAQVLTREIKQRAADFDPEGLSKTAWSLAKLNLSDFEALMAISRSAMNLIDDFSHQSVSNLVWAFATLRIADSDLYCACFQRASVTLYGSYKDHTRRSALERVLHWAQTYIAYDFCRLHCPKALHGASDQLLADLALMRQRHRSDDQTAFSTDSGLTSQRALCELDRLIEQMASEAVDNSQVDDSFEADVLKVETATANAEISARLLHRRVGATPIHLYTFSRSPREYRAALMEGPELEPCRRALSAAGCRPELPQGVKVFVHPEQYAQVVAHIQSHGLELRARHVLVAADFEEQLLEAIGSLSCSLQIRAKEFEGHAVQDHGQLPNNILQHRVEVSHGFIQFDLPRKERSRHTA